MMSFGLPWVFAAGGALAAAAVVLHLFAPRPPDRAPLPTARFLREDPRMLVRLRRTPSDVPVLALRVAVALLLGALFAEPRWLPDREDGTTRVVLLDRGAGMADVADAALVHARTEAEAGRAAVVVPFDTATAESSYLNALRALRGAAIRSTSTTHVEAVLVTRPRWSAWDDQLAALRDVAWPGPIRVIDPGPPIASGDEKPGAVAPERPPRVAVVPDPQGKHRAPRAALEVLGYQVQGGVAGGGSGAGILRFMDSADSALAAAPELAGRGDTVVVYGATASSDSVGPLWDPQAWPRSPTPPRFLRVGAAEMALGEGVARAPGAAVVGPGRRLPIAWEDGAPAASAMTVGDGCVVRFGGPLDTAARDPGYPGLLRALADGCRDARIVADAAPLDSAALTLLRGQGEEAVEVASLGDPGGYRLESWILLALMMVAVVETVLVASGRGRGGPG